MTTENSTVEKKLNLGTLFFLLLFILFIFISLLCLDETKYQEGSFSGLLALGFSLFALWSQRHPFYPLAVGLLFYLASIATLTYFFPRVVVDGTGFLSPYIYMLLGFLFNVYLLSKGYQKWKSKTSSLPNAIQHTVLTEPLEVNDL